MTGTFPDRIRKTAESIPSLIVITSVLAVAVNWYLLFVNGTGMFDPLFYIPIVLSAYYYPKRGVALSGAFAVIYLLVVMLVPSATHETALASFGHAGIFVIIGWAVSFLRLRYPQERPGTIIPPAGVPSPAGIPSKTHGLVAGVIAVSTVLAFALNGWLLMAGNNLIFDPLFYFPIILIAYFYPKRGVLATAAYAFLFCGIVLAASGSSEETVVTGLLHAGIFVIIGFVLSYIVLLYSHEQEIHKRLAEIVESSGDAIIGETREGTITGWNSGAGRLYGYAAAGVRGRQAGRLRPPERQGGMQEILGRVKNGEAIERYETGHVTKDNRRIRVSLTVSPIRNDSGTVIGASVIAYDITERKLAEEALTRANRKLQLFSSITRHDVLNQLTVLNIYHNLTESMTEDPVALSFLDKAKKAADAISQQIQFTHEYQEIGAQKPRWMDIRQGFLSAAAMYKARPVAFAPCDEGIEIYADPLLGEVFSKLIENSLTYGAVVTAIRCSCHEDESGLVIVYEDDGVGIPAEDKQKIFDKAVGDEPRFGLFLIREILSITNIAIAETGTSGKGARFEIRVPKGEYRFSGAKRPGGPDAAG